MLLAAGYGFTDEELEFIPSTKLRAGSDDIDSSPTPHFYLFAIAKR